ncbi:hypothetical protein HKX48_005794 [Thoreauomyces humboldtii]|nr:hypothetical protein HKX48_005794 [Thoreauomyces humboldtii]
MFSQPAASRETCRLICASAAGCVVAVWSQIDNTCVVKHGLDSVTAVTGGTDPHLVFSRNTSYRAWYSIPNTAYYNAPNPMISYEHVNFTGTDEALGGSLCVVLASCAAFTYRSHTQVGYLFSRVEISNQGSQVAQSASTAWVKPIL